MLTVTMFLWADPASSRNELWEYHVGHVNVLVRQVARHLSLAHEFVLVADRQPIGLDARVRVVPLDRTTFVAGTRFAKLMLFRPDIGALVGQRILYLDLDTVITGSLDDIAGRCEDLVLWRHPRWGQGRANVAPYNSSVMLMDAGARPQVWVSFPRGEDRRSMRRRLGNVRGEDQAWMGKVLGPSGAVWTDADGIYSARMIGRHLPDNARLVTFPGAREPGLAETQALYPWIAEHRR